MDQASIIARGVGQTPFPIAAIPSLDSLSTGQIRIILRLARLQWGFHGRTGATVRISKLADKLGMSAAGIKYNLQLLSRPSPKNGMVPLVAALHQNGSASTYTLIVPGSNLIGEGQHSAADASPNILSIPNDYIEKHMLEHDAKTIRAYLRIRLLLQTGQNKPFTAKTFNNEPITAYNGAVAVPPLCLAKNSRAARALDTLADLGVLKSMSGDDGAFYSPVAGGTKTIPVGTETIPVGTKTSSVETETIPVHDRTKTSAVGTETIPVGTKTSSVETETIPVGTETIPVGTKTSYIDVSQSVIHIRQTDRQPARLDSIPEGNQIIIEAELGDEGTMTVPLDQAISLLAEIQRPDDKLRFMGAMYRKAVKHGIALIASSSDVLNIGPAISRLLAEKGRAAADDAVLEIRNALDIGEIAEVYDGDQLQFEVVGREGRHWTVRTHGGERKIEDAALRERIIAIGGRISVRGKERPTPEAGSIEWVLSALERGDTPVFSAADSVIEVMGVGDGDSFTVSCDGVEKILGIGAFVRATLNMTPSLKSGSQEAKRGRRACRD